MRGTVASLIMLLTAALVLCAASSPCVSAIVDLHLGTVALYRDEWGMAHIYAAREEDGYFGLGYASGQDRLVQTLFEYLIVRGEVAKYFGKGAIKELPGVYQADPRKPLITDTVEIDRAMLLGRYLVDARANFHRLSPQVQRDIQAYMAGLKAYMRGHSEEVPAWAPQLEPALAPAVLAMALSPFSADPCTNKLPSVIPTALATAAPRPLSASNVWALASPRTADHGTLFASDSHGSATPFVGPTFYLFRLSTPTLDIFALGFPGSAVAIFGHSRNFAWGWSEAPRMTADCYAVKTLPPNPTHYLYDGHEQRMELVPYRIEIKGENPIEGTFEYTHHNGVRSPVVLRTGNVAYVISDAYMGRVGYMTQQFHELAAAHDHATLLAALHGRDLYPANLLIAGADGTLLYARPGRIPRRAPGVDPRKILDGNRSQTSWRGIHSFEEDVQLWNPSQGYVSNSNVSPDMMYPETVLHARDYPDYFGFDSGQTNSRQRRLIELLEGTSRVSDADAQAILFDTRIPRTEKWGAVIGSVVRADMTNASSELNALHAPELPLLLDDLTRFDGNFAAASRGAFDYLYLRIMLQRHSKPELDALSAAINSDQPLTMPMKQMLVKAVVDTFKAIRNDGPCSLGHPFGDIFRVGRGALDLPASGGAFYPDLESVSASLYGPRANTCRQFMVGGPRAPFVVHFGQQVRSWSAVLWGASEDPQSSHFSDQSRLISARRLRENWFEPDELSSHIVSTEILSAQTGLPLN